MPVSNDFNFLKDIKQSPILEVVAKERIIPYLEKNVFPLYKFELIEFHDEEDNSLQYAGCDFLGTPTCNNMGLRPIYIDVKFQANNYIDNPSPTFSIETGFFRNGRLKRGWSNNNFKYTDYFLFCWIYLSDYTIIDNRRFIKKPEDVHVFESLLVPVKSVTKYLYEHDLTDEDIWEITTKLNGTYNGVCYNIYGETPKWNYEKKNVYIYFNDIKFVWSCLLMPERPVNIIISKYEYFKKMDGSQFFLTAGNETQELSTFLSFSKRSDKDISYGKSSFDSAIRRFSSEESRNLISQVKRNYFG